MIVPHTNRDLTSGTGNANSSPWVIAIKNAGIPALGSIVNACILISAWSAGNAYCYVGSRIIVAMSIDKQLPKVFAKTNRWGVPYYAVITSWLFGPLAYLSLGTGGAAQAFSWLLNLVSIISLSFRRFSLLISCHSLSSLLSPVFSPGVPSLSPTFVSTRLARFKVSTETSSPSKVVSNPMQRGSELSDP